MRKLPITLMVIVANGKSRPYTACTRFVCVKRAQQPSAPPIAMATYVHITTIVSFSFKQRQSQDEHEKQPDQTEVNIQMPRLEDPQPREPVASRSDGGLKQQRPEDRSDVVFETSFLTK